MVQIRQDLCTILHPNKTTLRTITHNVCFYKAHARAFLSDMHKPVRYKKYSTKWEYAYPIESSLSRN